MKRFAVIACLLLLTSCSTESLDQSDAAVRSFHQLLDAGRFDAIYDGSSPEMKASTSREKLTALLGAVHRKLGVVKESKRVNFNVFFGTGGNRVTSGWATRFERGPAEETFIYSASGNTPRLIGYHINSDILITG